METATKKLSGRAQTETAITREIIIKDWGCDESFADYVVDMMNKMYFMGKEEGETQKKVEDYYLTKTRPDIEAEP